MFSYADELLEQTGLSDGSEVPADRGVYPLDGCVVVYYAPQDGQSVVVFESRDGGFRLSRLNPSNSATSSRSEQDKAPDGLNPPGLFR